MGAAASEVTSQTRELLLEAATFSGPRIRRMSVALGLRTEASTRHEKGLPLGLSTWGAARATQLLVDAGAIAHAPFAAGATDEAAAPIELELARITSLLGVPVSQDEATRALHSLGFSVSATGLNALLVTAPLWRADIRIVEDVIEEVARVVGYDRIVAEMPPVLAQTVTSDAYRAEKRVAHALAGAGYREAVTFALQPGAIARAYERANVSLPGDVVEITNPLSEDQRYLRFSLLPALLELAAKYARDEPYRAFEIGHVFAADGDAPPLETAGVAWLLALPPAGEPTWKDTGFLAFKAESLAIVRALTGHDAQTVTATLQGYHPGKTAQLLANGRDIATIGAVDPRLANVFEVRARVYAGWMRFADLPSAQVPRYAAPSRYPRDRARSLARRRPGNSGTRYRTRDPRGQPRRHERARVRRIPRPASRDGQEESCGAHRLAEPRRDPYRRRSRNANESRRRLVTRTLRRPNSRMKPANPDGSVDVRILSEGQYVRAKAYGLYISITIFAIALVVVGFACYLKAYPIALSTVAIALSVWTVGRPSFTLSVSKWLGIADRVRFDSAGFHFRSHATIPSETIVACETSDFAFAIGLTTSNLARIVLVRDGREVGANVRAFALLREAMPITTADTTP